MWGMHWGLLCGTSGKKELCTVPCHSCHIYGIWTSRSSKVWGMLKSHQMGWRWKSQKGDSFHSEGRFSQCNTAVLWNFIDWVYSVKNFIRSLFHYITVVLWAWGWQGQKCKSKCPNDINSKWVIPEKSYVFCFTLGNSRQNKALPLDFSHNIIVLHPSGILRLKTITPTWKFYIILSWSRPENYIVFN